MPAVLPIGWLRHGLAKPWSTNVRTVHDPDYRVALQDFQTFTEQLSEQVVEADELIPELPVKDVVSCHTSLLS
jgi:hypothetical protein